MDRNRENEHGFFDNVKSTFYTEAKRREGNTALLLSDILVFLLGFLFSRCHLAFGTYPLSIALLATLKGGVWISLLGSVIGSISLGKSGVIYAIVALITVFLRIIISGGSEKKTFSEGTALKIASCGIGALVSGIYQILLSGFSFTSLLLALLGVSLACGFTLVFSGIYLTDISFHEVLFSKNTVFSRKNFATDKEKFDLLIFQGTLLALIFLIGFSLREYEFLGISPAYIYSAFLTLFTAKRFGALRGGAVGFVSSLAVSGIYAPSFALVGLAAGLLFSFGAPYAVIGSAALLTVYNYYVGGVTGIVSTFPEFMCASLLALPAFRAIEKEKVEKEIAVAADTGERMVNIASLSYKNKSAREGELGALKTIKSLSKVVKNAGRGEGVVGYEEYRDAVVYDVREHCLCCPSYESCISESPAPCAENIDLIAEKLAKGERLYSDDINLFPKYCQKTDELLARILKSAVRLEESHGKNRRMDIRAKDYEFVGKLLEESFDYEAENTLLNSTESERVETLLNEFGIGEPTCKIFGTRKRHIICAGADPEGKISTSKELKAAMEKLLSARLSDGEFYKKDKHILFEYDEVCSYECNFAFSTSVKCRETVNGDTLVSFKSDDGKFYALLSDGEGSGAGAREVSGLSCDFLSEIFTLNVSKDTAFQALNHILRHKERERSATIDLFELDLYTGEAVFYKCGATSSYIKRDGSIFRVRSQSAPIGVMSGIDAERIRVDVKHGDYVILFSDGALTEGEDSTWLVELINKERVGDIKEYADMILNKAKSKTGNVDDMSVAVIKISKN